MKRSPEGLRALHVDRLAPVVGVVAGLRELARWTDASQVIALGDLRAAADRLRYAVIVRTWMAPGDDPRQVLAEVGRQLGGCTAVVAVTGEDVIDKHQLRLMASLPSHGAQLEGCGVFAYDGGATTHEATALETLRRICAGEAG